MALLKCLKRVEFEFLKIFFEIFKQWRFQKFITLKIPTIHYFFLFQWYRESSPNFVKLNIIGLQWCVLLCAAGLKDLTRCHRLHLKTMAVIVGWIVICIAQLTIHHWIKLTGYVEPQKFVLSICVVMPHVINSLILQLSMQLQQSSAYWSDKVRQLSSQLEESTPLHQWN